VTSHTGSVKFLKSLSSKLKDACLRNFLIPCFEHFVEVIANLAYVVYWLHWLLNLYHKNKPYTTSLFSVFKEVKLKKIVKVMAIKPGHVLYWLCWFPLRKQIQWCWNLQHSYNELANYSLLAIFKISLSTSGIGKNRKYPEDNQLARDHLKWVGSRWMYAEGNLTKFSDGSGDWKLSFTIRPRLSVYGLTEGELDVENFFEVLGENLVFSAWRANVSVWKIVQGEIKIAGTRLKSAFCGTDGIDELKQAKKKFWHFS